MWRDAVVAATRTARRKKGVWSSLGLGLSLALLIDYLGDSLGETIGDIIVKYGARLRE